MGHFTEDRDSDIDIKQLFKKFFIKQLNHVVGSQTE
jgi:hypothetical protein